MLHKIKALPFTAACALLGATVATNANPYTVTIQPVGSNVVAMGGGQIDLTGLTFFFSFGQDPGIIPDLGVLSLSSSASLLVDGFSGISGPNSFGPGGFTLANTFSGPLVHLDPGLLLIGVPSGYSSDSVLATSKDTWDNATLASLGVTPGTYIWTWGTGADQSFTLDILATPAIPISPALPLFATGLGALGLLGWRRKRKAELA
jgi:hypothetical protein